MTTPVWIGLGSNLGDRRAILDEAVVRLNQAPGVVLSRVSSYRETTPVGGPPGQGPFLNAAARLDTVLSPRELLGVTQRIEAELGRVRTARWGERTLDLDLLICGSKFVDEPDLKLPHPRLAVRRFVLEPLAEIAPWALDTVSHATVAQLLANLDRQPRLVLLDRSICQVNPGLGRCLAAALSGHMITLHPNESAAGHYHSADSRLDRRDELLPAQAEQSGGFPELVEHARWVFLSIRMNGLGPGRWRRDLTKRSRLDATTRRFIDQDPHFVAANIVAGYEINLAKLTMIVATESSRFKRHPTSQPSAPVYWPEATDADGVVAEVVAICRGIEGV